MEKVSLNNELASNTYPGRGIVVGKTADGKHAAIAYLSWAEVKTAETGYL